MYYAIGDIHGEIELLLDLYEKVVYDIDMRGESDNTIVFLGDYIDRGHGSIKVLDFLISLRDTQSLKHVFIRGNHEYMFLEAIENPLSHSDVGFWVNNGGMAVLREVGMDWDYFRETFPFQQYTRWIREETKFYHETKDYVFVHGGVDVRRDVCSQMPDYLIWARHMEKNHYRGYKKMVIHGHTSFPEPFIDENRVCVDTSYHPSKKILTAVILNNSNDGYMGFLQSERTL